MQSRIVLPVRVLLAAASLLPACLSAQTFTSRKLSIGGEGGHDYIMAEAGTGRVFISRGTHVMVVDGATGTVLGDLQATPRVHGIAVAPSSNHGFTTNAGDSSVTMFDLKTLMPIRKIATHTGGLDGIMYDDYSNRIVLTNHSRPIGTVTWIDATSGDIVGTTDLEDTAPEGAASDGKGRLFVNNEGTSTMQVIDEKTLKPTASWSLAPCDGPTGIAYERSAQRIFSGCSDTSVVVDAKSGRVVAKIANGRGVDALGYDPTEKLLYIPAGGSGNVTVVRMDSPDNYTVIATVATAPGVKTIAVDPVTHRAYGFVPEYGPAPTPAPGATPPTNGRPPRGPIIGGSFFVISH